jgi:hypothetical protein
MDSPPINSFDASGAKKNDDVIIGNQNLGPPGEAAAMLRRQIVVCRARIEVAKLKPSSAKVLAGAEQWLVELTHNLAHVESLIAASQESNTVSDDDLGTDDEHEYDHEIARLANLGLAPGQMDVYGVPSPSVSEARPLTSRDLDVIMGAFHKLVSQQADFEKRLASGLVPAQGKLVPGSDPKDADCFAVVADGKAETGSKKRAVVKSTVELPGPLRLRMKSMEIERKISGQKLIVAAIEEFLVKRGF